MEKPLLEKDGGSETNRTKKMVVGLPWLTRWQSFFEPFFRPFFFLSANGDVSCCFCTIGMLFAMPNTFWRTCGNTTSFSKNHGVHMMASCLVASRCFARVTLNYLVVGHTHEDVDAFLAELLPVSRRSMFNSTSDAVSILGTPFHYQPLYCPARKFWTDDFGDPSPHVRNSWDH